MHCMATGKSRTILPQVYKSTKENNVLSTFKFLLLRNKTGDVRHAYDLLICPLLLILESEHITEMSGSCINGHMWFNAKMCF